MKKVLVTLFTLGLIFAFIAPAYATEVSISGSLRVRGWLESNNACLEKGESSQAEVQQDWYDQRLRVQTVFKVEEGLKLTVRFDALERIWGEDPISDDINGSANIRFGRSYVTFRTALGTFDVGYMSGGAWGTVFNDDEADGVPRIKYTNTFGPVIFIALLEKGVEKDGLLGSNSEDEDYDKYVALGIYQWQGGQAGLMGVYLPNKTSPTSDTTFWYVSPYFKANFGQLYVEGEATAWYGKTEFDSGADDIDYEGYSWYIYAKYNMGPAYFGAQYGHNDGDDPNTDENEAGFVLNADWDPCLILFNYWLTAYQGNLGGSTIGTEGMLNGSLYQVFGGFSPMEKLSIFASITYAEADEKPLNYVDDDYGWEFDVTATYKIFENLEYTIGFGYLFAGDYFKKTDASAHVEDNYLLMHELKLTF